MWKKCLAFGIALTLLFTGIPTVSYATGSVDEMLEMENEEVVDEDIDHEDSNDESKEEVLDESEVKEDAPEPDTTEGSEETENDEMDLEEDVSIENDGEDDVAGDIEAEPEEIEAVDFNAIYAAASTGTYQPEGASYALRYSLDDNGVKITGISDKNAEGELIIPAEIDGIKVTSIDRLAFYGCSGLTGKLIIPDGITSIGGSAFNGCKNLGGLTLPASMVSIDFMAFKDCSGLTGDLILPNGIISIGRSAFENCSGLTGELIIPNSVTAIGDSAFSGCKSLTGDLIITNNEISIGEYAFKYCSSLTGSLILPDKMIAIDTAAFANCGISKINIPDSVITIGNSAFSGCSGITGELNIPDSVTTIGNSAFSGCSGITGELNIPDSVTTIGNIAFSGCSEITGNLNISGSVATIGDYAFSSCSGLTTLSISNGVKSIGKSAFQNCNGLTDITIPESVISIGTEAFLQSSDGIYKITILGNNVSIDSKGLGTGKFIYGYSGSTAETYAADESNKCTFFALDDLEEHEIEEYRVSTTEELLAAIGSYRRIILADGIYEIVESYIRPEPGKGWQHVPDTGTLILSNLVSLSIEAENPGRVEILSLVDEDYLAQATEENPEIGYGSTVPVVEIYGCTDIKIKGCILGHESNLAACSYGANVVNISSSFDIVIEYCDLFGCGYIGLECTGVNNVNVDNCVIRDCENNITSGSNVKELRFTDCILSGHRGWRAALSCSGDIAFKTCKFINNKNRTFDDYNAVVDNCSYYNNAWDGKQLDSSSGICLNGITWQLEWKYYEDKDEYGYILKLGYPIKFDNGTIKSAEGTVLDYSDAALPWKEYKSRITEIKYYDDTDAPDLNDPDNPNDPIWNPEQLKPPTANLPSGSVVDAGTKIRLSSDIEGANIYYTLDGTQPSEESNLYTAPIIILEDVTITAYVTKKDYLDSDIATFIYTVSDNSGQGDVLDEDIPQGGIDKIPKGLWMSKISVQDYTGKAIKPVVRVYDYKTLLVEKKDYTISYKNNTKANDASTASSAPTITITGKGNYTGKEVQTFIIETKKLTDEDVIADNITLQYNGKTQKPVPVITWNGKKLSNKKDFTVSYPETAITAYQVAGIYKILVTGKGNYAGTREIELKITDNKPVSKLKIGKISNQTYTGGEIKPTLVIKDGKTVLKENVHYTVSYQNNVAVGTASAIVEGMGDYAGTKRITFKIIACASLNKAKADIKFHDAIVYTGTEVKPDNCKLTVVVKNSDNKGVEVTLSEGIDYEISYQNNVKAGKATVIFKGINGYNGMLKKTYRINAYDMEEGDVGKNKKIIVELGNSYAYTKGGCKPKPIVTFNGDTLREGIDYTLSYKNNTALYDGSSMNKIPTVVVKGKGNFKGSRTETYLITQKNIRDLTLTASDKVWKNKKNIYKTSITIKDTDGKNLSAGKDYDKSVIYMYDSETTLSDGTVRTAGSKISTNDIIPVGTVIRVSVTAKGANYFGTISGTYRITAADISKAKVTVPAQAYTGKAIEPNDEVEVKLNGAVISKENYEIIGYSNNINKGTATLTIRGKNNCGGMKNVKFKIKGKGFLWWKTDSEPDIEFTAEDAYKAYNVILEEYAAACAIDSDEWFANTEEYIMQYPDVNRYWLDEYHTPSHFDELSGADEPCEIAYFYFDIDGNAIPELIFVHGHHEASFFEIYTFDGTKAAAIGLKKEDSTYDIYTNGIVSVYSTDVEYYKFNDDGYTLKKISLSFDEIRALDNYSIWNSDFEWTILAYDVEAGVTGPYLSAEELHAVFKEQTASETEAYFFADDFDGDGIIEAFGITGQYSEGDELYTNVQIYYITCNGTCNALNKYEEFYGYLSSERYAWDSALLEVGTKKFLVWELSANGSGSTSYIYGVRNGQVYRPEISGKYMCFASPIEYMGIIESLPDADTYVGYKSDFSVGFHDYIPHYFKFDLSQLEFVEQ